MLLRDTREHSGTFVRKDICAHGRERARVSGLAAKKREIVVISCKLSNGAVYWPSSTPITRELCRGRRKKKKKKKNSRLRDGGVTTNVRPNDVNGRVALHLPGACSEKSAP
jgi:hypothetical protein